MLMFTYTAYEEQFELARRVERLRIAGFLRQRAEMHPKWEVHDLLIDLAKELEEDAGKTD